jgi:hypothetical protein
MNVTKAIRVTILTLIGAVAMIAAGCADSDARSRRAAVATKASTAPVQQEQVQKPIKWRYYGGPKGQMFPG